MENVRWRVAAALTLAAAVGIVYHPALSAYFFDDDFQWLVGSWFFDPVNLVDFTRLMRFYRPVMDLYLAVATRLFEGSAAWFHAASVAVHALNGLLVFAFARRMSHSPVFGFLTALFFVVQPADVDAVVWVSALSEVLSVCFGLLALLGLLLYRRTARRRWQVLSLAAFLLALLTHESAIMFLPLVVLTAHLVEHGDGQAAGLHGWRELTRPLVPYGLIAAVDLAIDLSINSRNYVVSEGHYAIGPHAIANALDYVVALYVGRRDAANYVLVALGLPLLLLRGNLRVRFAACWIVMAMLPFVWFTWGTASRYLYFPAIGFAMLLAEGVVFAGGLLGSRFGQRARISTTALLAGALAVRSMSFAVENVKAFAARTETYRTYAQDFRQLHGPLSPYSRVQPEPRLHTEHEPRFVTALIQWEYRDPTIELILPADATALR